MTTAVWILGQSGLLGSAIAETIRRSNRQTLWQPGCPMPWDDPLRLAEELRSSAEAFFRFLKENDAERWLIVWAAGTSVMGSSEEHLATETDAFRRFLSALKESMDDLPMPGTVFFASSAGALYSSGGTATEETEVAPRTPYGEAKLLQEELLRVFAMTHPNVRAVIGRISTLFGKTQNPAKAQGLISRLSRSSLEHRTLPIFVPLSTSRDYLFAPDCAAMILSFLEALPHDASAIVTKIFAAEKSTSIAELLRLFRDVTKHPPRVVPQRSELTERYAPTISLRSTTLPRSIAPHTPLPAAIHRIHLHNQRLFMEGRMTKQS